MFSLESEPTKAGNPARDQPAPLGGVPQLITPLAPGTEVFTLYGYGCYIPWTFDSVDGMVGKTPLNKWFVQLVGLVPARKTSPSQWCLSPISSRNRLRLCFRRRDLVLCQKRQGSFCYQMVQPPHVSGSPLSVTRATISGSYS